MTSSFLDHRANTDRKETHRPSSDPRFLFRLSSIRLPTGDGQLGNIPTSRGPPDVYTRRHHTTIETPPIPGAYRGHRT